MNTLTSYLPKLKKIWLELEISFSNFLANILYMEKHTQAVVMYKIVYYYNK